LQDLAFDFMGKSRTFAHSCCSQIVEPFDQLGKISHLVMVPVSPSVLAQEVPSTAYAGLAPLSSSCSSLSSSWLGCR